MGDVNKWCPMCGAAPGESCTTLSGSEAGWARPVPHFYRHSDTPRSVLVPDEPSFAERFGSAMPPSARRRAA